MMEAIDKLSGAKVEVVQILDKPTVEIKSEGESNYRKLTELEILEGKFLELNDTVKVTLTYSGAEHLSKVKKRKYYPGQRYKNTLWMLLKIFSPCFVSGAEAPFRNLRRA